MSFPLRRDGIALLMTLGMIISIHLRCCGALSMSHPRALRVTNFIQPKMQTPACFMQVGVSSSMQFYAILAR